MRFILLILMAFNVAFATTTETSDNEEKIQAAVDKFFVLELLGAEEVQYNNHDCDDYDRSNCLQTACSLMPSYKCDEPEELRAVARMCKQVRGGACIKDACSRLPSYKCDQLEEIDSVARLCSNLPFKAIDTACSFLSAHRCNDLRDLQAVGQVFQNTTYQTLRCLKYTCSQFPSYRCDELRELATVVDICQGNP